MGCTTGDYHINTDKVVLVSIDGLRPEFYLSGKYPTPTLQQLAREGRAYKALIPVFPTLTYPNHTSIITGERPSTHGIISNTIFDVKKGPTSEWYWDHKYIQVKTISDILEEKGYKTASIHWPVTLNANITYLMPEIFPVKGYYTDSPWELVRKFDTSDIVDEINEKMNLKEFHNQEESDFWATQAAIYLLKEKKPKLTLLHLTNLDKIQHQYGRESDRLNDGLKVMDQKIFELKKSMPKGTCLIIVGDHGFKNYNKIININKLFYNKGWIELDENNELKSWKVIAHKGGAQAAIYLNDKNIKNDVVNLLIESQDIGYNYISRNKLNTLGSYPGALAAISSRDGFSIGDKIKDEILINLSEIKGQHGHFISEDIKSGLIFSNCTNKYLPSTPEVENTEVFKVLKNILLP